MLHDARRSLLAAWNSGSVDSATTKAAQATQASIFGAGMCIFLLNFLVFQWFLIITDNYSPFSFGPQALLVATALFQSCGLVLMTIADLDMDLYVSKRKRAMLVGIAYYGRQIDQTVRIASPTDWRLFCSFSCRSCLPEGTA